MRNFSVWVIRELRDLFPVWLFFFLSFSLLRLTQTVAVEQLGLSSTTPSLVLVGSLIVAKSFLVLDLFHFVERFQQRPLIYATIWKTGIYYGGAMIIYFLEQLVEITLKRHSFPVARIEVFRALGTPHFWVVQIWLFLLVFAYTATRETIRTLGKQRFLNMWFGKQETPPALLPRKAA